MDDTGSSMSGEVIGTLAAQSWGSTENSEGNEPMHFWNDSQTGAVFSVSLFGVHVFLSAIDLYTQLI